MPSNFQKYTSSEIHWLLIEATDEQRRLDDAVSDDGYVAAQALFCPYYTTLEGNLGGDWGVIVNPESIKFGRLVFEHEWCGCETYTHQHGDILAVHGSGKQKVDEWLLPSCRAVHNFRNKTLGMCLRPKGHRGKHRDHIDRQWS